MDNNYTSLEDCIENNFGKTILDCNRCYSLQNITDWDVYLHSSIIGIIIILSLLGNFLFFVVLLKYKKLRYRTSLVSLSLLLANMCFMFSLHLQIVISTLARKWLFEFTGCQVFGFLSTHSILARWLNMGVLALDRFCAVRFPFSYSKHSKLILGILLSSSWIIPALLSIVTVQGYASVVFRPNTASCLFYAPTIDRGLLYFSFVSTFAFLIGAVLPIALYSWLFHKAKVMRNSMFMTTNRSSGNVLDSQEAISSEQKALLTFGIIFVAFCLTGIPSYLFQVIRWFNSSAWCGIPHTLHFRVTEIYLSSSAIDPILVMRSTDFRKRLKHMLCCHNNCGKYYVNRKSIHSQIPPERNFDAVRTVATKALKLAVIAPSGDRVATAPTGIPHRPRSGSVPAISFTSTVGLKNVNKKTLSDTQLKDQTEGWLPIKKVVLQNHSDFSTTVVYSDGSNRERVDVSISFD